MLYAGYDPHYQFQLYHSDPSGNYSGWKATCIGANNGTAQSLLKQDYKNDIDVNAAVALAIQVMSKTMDSTVLSSEKRRFSRILLSGNHVTDEYHPVEFAILTLDKRMVPQAKIFKPAEIDALLAKHGIEKDDETKS